jgi:hypothetical protein
MPRLHPVHVSHGRLGGDDYDHESFLARAFGDEWGHPVTSWRLEVRGDAPGTVSYDLLWPHGVGELETALREAGATDIEVATYRDTLPPPQET